MHLLPKAEITDDVAIAHPVLDDEAGIIGIAEAGHIAQGEEVPLCPTVADFNLEALGVDVGRIWLSGHMWRYLSRW